MVFWRFVSLFHGLVMSKTKTFLTDSQPGYVLIKKESVQYYGECMKTSIETVDIKRFFKR